MTDGRVDRAVAPGADPNYSGNVYHGMRRWGEGRGAPYGWHRLTRADDLEAFGGYRGHGEPRVEPVFHGDPRPRGRSGRSGRAAPAPAHGGAAPRPAGGGVRRDWHDLEYLRDFNTRSPALRPAAGAADRRLPSGAAGDTQADDALRRLRDEGPDPRYGHGRGSAGFVDP